MGVQRVGVPPHVNRLKGAIRVQSGCNLGAIRVQKSAIPKACKNTQSPPAPCYMCYMCYMDANPLSPGSLLYVLYLTRQPTEHPLSPIPCYMCYMCYILHAKPLNIHSPPAPCYMYYMCYIFCTREICAICAI